MNEATKQLANKSQVDAVLDAADKNIEKIKKTSNVWFQLFYVDNDESQNCLVFQFLFKSSATPTGSDWPF